MDTTWDTIVIGGGAAGLSAALMLGRARRRTLVIDSGSPRNRFAAHMHGVLGLDGVSPAELLRRGRAEVRAYGVELLDGAVARVEDADDLLDVTLEDGAVHRARTVIVATGITDELPAVPGLAERWGVSVLHCPYCHGWEVRDRRIGVLTTSPMGLHQAELVRQWSDRVTVFTAGAGELDPATARRLRSRDVVLVAEPVVEVLGDGPALRAVRTADGAEFGCDLHGGRPAPARRLSRTARPDPRGGAGRRASDRRPDRPDEPSARLGRGQRRRAVRVGADRDRPRVPDRRHGQHGAGHRGLRRRDGPADARR